MEDVNKIKPYIAHLNKQLSSLKADLNKLTTKSLDEQLLSLTNERAKLDLTNKYAYALSSLMFSYMKVLNVKDMSPIMTELTRVKSYMDRAKALDENDVDKLKRQQKEQDRAKRIINNALDGRQTGPAISKVNFQGKHTRFDTAPTSKDDKAAERREINAKEISKGIKDSKQNRTKPLKNGKISKKRG